MKSEISEQIFRQIDDILAAIRQTDYEAFRGIAQKASILLANLAMWSAKVAEMSRDDLVALIQEKPQPDRERILRLLTGLREALPLFGEGLVEAAVRTFPLDRGGRPKSFKEREKMRQACRKVLELIDKGKSETEAKRAIAKEFKVGYQTMHRTWQKRVEFEELSFDEFITRFVDLLSTKDATKIPEGGSGETRSPEEIT